MKNDLTSTFPHTPAFLMEGALGERLKHEHNLPPDPNVGLARHAATPKGRQALSALWGEYAQIAAACSLPFLALTPTRRSDHDRVQAANLTADLITENVRFLQNTAANWPGTHYLGGMIGCYGEAYTGADCLSQAQAREYHRWQVQLLAASGIDFLFGALLPTLPETLGLAQAMSETNLPYILSFTLRPDGTLPDGTPLSQAITIIDAETARPPLCYMSNCVHPTLVYRALTAPCNQNSPALTRFQGIQGNASAQDFTTLSRASDLLSSDPASFAQASLNLRTLAPLRIFGGCCGTDGRHIRQLARRLTKPPA